MDIPQIGLGTSGLSGESGQHAILNALNSGYRHIDTADWYRNHLETGNAIKQCGVPREEIFLTTKIYPPFGAAKVLAAGQRFLKELQIDYIDLILVHWTDGSEVAEMLDPMMKLIDGKITKKIGVSNFTAEQITAANKLGYPIYNHQTLIYPGHPDHKMTKLCTDLGIRVTAYSTLKAISATNKKKLRDMALTLNISTSQLALAWLMSKKVVVIPKATTSEHQSENLEATRIILPANIISTIDKFS